MTSSITLIETKPSSTNKGSCNISKLEVLSPPVFSSDGDVSHFPLKRAKARNATLAVGTNKKQALVHAIFRKQHEAIGTEIKFVVKNPDEYKYWSLIFHLIIFHCVEIRANSPRNSETGQKY